MSRFQYAILGLCAAFVPSAAMAAIQQQSPPRETKSDPEEARHGEWIGKCERFDSYTPSADCPLIYSKIKPQLKLFEDVKKWAEPKRKWSEPPKLLPKGGPFKVLYVNNEASTLERNRTAIGGYSEGYGLFIFNQSDVQKADPLAATDIASGWADMHRFVAHEVFHAYQATSPFGKTYYQTRKRDDPTFAWIWEGSAEGFGLAYQVHALGKYRDIRSPNYHRPLHMTDDGGYDRGEFWLGLANVMSPRDLGQFLFDLHDSPERLTIGEPMTGIDWLHRQLLNKGASLRHSYGKVIAQLPIEGRYSPNGEDGYTPITFDANGAEIATEVRSAPLNLPQLAASAFYARLPAEIMKVDNAELPGRKLVLFELQIDANSTPERVGLVVEREWVDLAIFTKLLVPEGQEVKFLGRATNVDERKPGETQATQARFHLISRAVNLTGPSCASVGKSSAITAEFAESKFGFAPKLEFRAKRGKFEGMNYTPPSTPGPDTLSVRAWSGAKGETEKWVAFEKPMIRQRCSVVLINPDGSRITYDAQSNATRVQDAEGSPPSYMDEKGIVAFNTETGRWFRVPHAASTHAAAALLGVQITTPGTNISTLAHGPSALVDMLKRMRKEAARTTPRPAETAVSCPSGGGRCFRFTHPAQAEAAIYFDQAGDPVGFEADGEMIRIEYNGDAVEVPIA